MIKVTAPYLLLLFTLMIGSTHTTRTTPQLSASVIRDATVLESTPNFTDLYIIQIQSKGKSVLIYCNLTSCYKQRSDSLIA